tara:strand:+ start:914 stop:1051 length:138 start_codon:yes stop_codon:yes gene_type:complete
MEKIDVLVLEQMIKEIPNDMDLGRQIRKLVLSIKNESTDNSNTPK